MLIQTNAFLISCKYSSRCFPESSAILQCPSEEFQLFIHADDHQAEIQGNIGKFTCLDNKCCEVVKEMCIWNLNSFQVSMALIPKGLNCDDTLVNLTVKNQSFQFCIKEDQSFTIRLNSKQEFNRLFANICKKEDLYSSKLQITMLYSENQAKPLILALFLGAAFVFILLGFLIFKFRKQTLEKQDQEKNDEPYIIPGNNNFNNNFDSPSLDFDLYYKDTHFSSEK